MSNFDKVLEKCQHIPTWMELIEQDKLFSLATEVPPGGTIVEVGCLYGGSTALLGHGCPTATIHVFDEFSWSPSPDMKAGRETLMTNLEKAGVPNEIILTEGDSRQTGKFWNAPIDLLWVDGGHSLEFIESDLTNFGPHAKVIACHDYDNPGWPTIRQAVKAFIAAHKEWHIDDIMGTVVVLRKENI